MPEVEQNLYAANEDLPARPKVLLVDDDEGLRSSLARMLEHNGFDITTAANVNQALALIASRPFDVLLSDLHMPDAGDGLTVVSAMRHANPKAVTLILSAFPEMERATAAILLQADGILVKPIAIKTLVQTIQERLTREVPPTPTIASAADILEQEAQVTIDDWLARIDLDQRLISVPLDDRDRSSHLPELFRNLVSRLRDPLPIGMPALLSPAAIAHGLLRRQQGYTAAMLVEESRLVQASIFQTLQNNLQRVDFRVLLVGVMAIADEVDSQLAQAMTSYVTDSTIDPLPLSA